MIAKLKNNSHTSEPLLSTARPETLVEVSPQVLVSPVWRVVVWDDPVNLANYVVWVFQRTFGYTESKARVLMEKVHFTGSAVVWRGAKEMAEMYVQKMHCYQLRATLEKDE